MVSPQQVIRELAEWSRPSSMPLNVFWITMQGERENFAHQLRLLRQQLAIVPLVVRDISFSDPNSVMNDVSSALSAARTEIETISLAVRNCGYMDLVLVSRKEWNLAISSSPVTLPTWFPISPEEVVTCRIKDLTWATAVPLSDRVAQLEDLRRLLYELDVSLTAKLLLTAAADSRRLKSLWSHLSETNGGSFTEELKRGDERLRGIRNPSEFRPSIKSRTTVGYIWAAANSTSPDRIARVARALTEGLQLSRTAVSDPPPLLAVLNRPSDRNISEEIWWCYCLVVAVRTACQFVTAAAHADEYARYPVALLRSVSLDLRSFLDGAVVRLQKECRECTA